MPDFSLEQQHDGPVFGLDEVGRGPLAGPVTAACVYIPKAARSLPFISEITDSKKLSETKLERLYGLITTHFEWRVVDVSPAEIDEINILQASLKAMGLALEGMETWPAHALVDGNKLPRLPCSATAVVKGDNKSVSIAAASIVAKVTRDRWMRDLHAAFPHYGWDTNVGYPSAAHRAAIDEHGITVHHRQSFAPVRNFLEYGSTVALDSNPLKAAG